MADKPIKVTWDDIRNPKVDAEIARQERQRGWAQSRSVPGAAMSEGSPTSKMYGSISKVAATGSDATHSILYSTPFYTCLAGAAGAFLAWLVIEPFWDDSRLGSESMALLAILWFPLIGGLVGLLVGAVEGVVSRSSRSASIGGAVGLGVGLAGGLVAVILAGIVYHVLGGGRADADSALGRQILARSIAWAMAGMFMGLGQGVALRSSKKLLNGFFGGLAGGFLGGLLFDPLAIALQSAELSRCVGMTLIGAAVGLLTAVAEQLTKDAWLHVVAGQLAGKQFVLYRNPTTIGSSPKCEIYLFKDAAIEPRHAAIHTVGSHREVEDLRSGQGIFVNGQPVSRCQLRNGDEIRVGKTIFKYSEKTRGR